MNLDEYQELATRTMSLDTTLVVTALGLCGEAGEFADVVKKHVGHGHSLDEVKCARELGDVLWYVAAAADRLGLSLSQVARMNIDKLRARYPNGFESARSVARAVGDT